jgi:hypothetical protein
MKTMKWPVRAIIFMGLLQVVSCTKTVDSTNNSISAETSNDLIFPVTNEFSGCKLRRIYQSYGEGNATVTGLFTYNAAGNPVSVLFNESFAGNHYFSYDKVGRLKDYRFSSDFGDGIHVYSYDANNRIITDTSKWGVGDYYLQIWISTFTYDSQGRIIKENIRNTLNNDVEGRVNPLEPTRNPTYTYDSRGNLAVAGWKSSSYDYKVSIFRSHPVFQFIHRNYSRNNSSVQAKYNSKGLPLSVLPGNDTFFSLPNVTKAIYDCQ